MSQKSLLMVAGNSQKISKGFTLIEVMIAVAVIAILAVVALPSYRNYIVRGDVDRCIKHILPARMTADNLMQNRVVFDGNPGALGLAAGNDCDAITVVDNNDGTASITGRVNDNSGNAINIMTLTRSANGTWACNSSNATFAPTNC